MLLTRFDKGDIEPRLALEQGSGSGNPGRSAAGYDHLVVLARFLVRSGLTADRGVQLARPVAGATIGKDGLGKFGHGPGEGRSLVGHTRSSADRDVARFQSGLPCRISDRAEGRLAGIFFVRPVADDGSEPALLQLLDMFGQNLARNRDMRIKLLYIHVLQTSFVSGQTALTGIFM